MFKRFIIVCLTLLMAGCVPDAVIDCPPLLGYQPEDASCFEPWTDAFAYAASLPPFEVDTECATVIVGVFTGEGCESPRSVDVFTTSYTGPAPDTLTFPVPMTHALTDAFAVVTLASGARAYSFHHPQHYPAGQRPLVGMVTARDACAVGLIPSCDPGRAWQYSTAWHTLKNATGSMDELYFAIGDCQAGPS